jgi:multidrug resistance efflux pump
MSELRSALVALRRLREDKALRALSPLQRACAQAQADVARAERQLEDWRGQAEEEQAAIYAGLFGQSVDRRAVERAMQRVDALRQRSRALERTLESARQASDKASDALRQGRHASAIASRATQKSMEVLNVYQSECARFQERRADDELDEIAALRHGRSAP